MHEPARSSVKISVVSRKARFALAFAQAHKLRSRHGKATECAKKVAGEVPSLPDGVKRGVEALAGFSLDNVVVHHSGPESGKLVAKAFAGGAQIHLAPGQEQHQPHEAWHVVQQQPGRVQPSGKMVGQQADGPSINDDPGLENEADIMGARALGTFQTLRL